MSAQQATELNNAKVEQIGRATARMHRLLKELGHKHQLEQTAATMPDARDRLSFIDQAMHEASEKTISAVENAMPLTSRNRATCSDLSARLAETDFGDQQALIMETVSRLGEIAAAEEVIHQNLMHIMEAQEFRDVAGQMVNKIVLAAAEIENILLDILKEYAPKNSDSLIRTEGLTAGPQTKRDNSINGQDEVDDLLASLGL